MATAASDSIVAHHQPFSIVQATTNSQEALVQDIYNGLFGALTGSAGGSGHPLLPPEQTMLTVCPVAEGLSAEGFENPWTPGNTQGSKDAAVNTATLVDDAPQFSSVYAKTAFSVTRMYEEIVNASVIAPPPNPALEKQYNEARDFLYPKTKDPETGQEKRQASTTYREYQKTAAEYAKVLAECNQAYEKAEATQKGSWPSVAAPYETKLKLAKKNWIVEGDKEEVERYIAQLATSSQGQVQKAFENAKEVFEGAGDPLEGPTDPKTWRPRLLPTNWWDSSDEGWTRVEYAQGESSKETTDDYTKWGAHGTFSYGLWSIGADVGKVDERKAMDETTSSLSVAYEYLLVTIDRPWMNLGLLTLPGWQTARGAGGYSDGAKDTGQLKTAMPLLPTAFILIRNLAISANWSHKDEELVKEHLEVSGSFGWGPFKLSGSYDHGSSKEKIKSQFEKGIIKVSGMQIIGWINQVVPFCPPQ